MVDVGSTVPFFPIQDRRLVAADDGRHIQLAQSEIEAPFSGSPNYENKLGCSDRSFILVQRSKQQ
jgi:hypothetical protein